MTKHIVVLITAPSTEVGAQIADALLAARAVACVNIIPAVSSFYLWQGEVNHDAEVLLIAKTTAEVFEDRLVPVVRAAHPYEVPEIIALPVVMGTRDYLDWVDESVGG